MTTAPAWMAARDDRPCQKDPDLWFSTVAKEKKAAVRACAACPLLGPCRAYALAEQPAYGVWGGLTVAQRTGKRPPRPRRTGLVPVDCNSPTAFWQHQRRNEDCAACQERRRVQIRAERQARLDAEHAAYGGSMRGYRAHVALGEPPCDRCRDANIRRLAERRRPSRDATARAAA